MANSNLPVFPKPKVPEEPKTTKKGGRPKKQPPTFTCSCCGTKFTKQDGNFLTSSSFMFEANGGYVTICKSCTEKLDVTAALCNKA